MVEFIETGFRKVCQTKEVKTGNIVDKFAPSVCGVGILGDRYPTMYKDKNGTRRSLREYEAWSGFLKRCYSSNCQSKSPTYRGCSASDNFKSYTYFYEWCGKQVGFNAEGFSLDKDILFKGNKVYSEDTCVFVPNEINCLFTKTNRLRGDYPIGVHYDASKKKFVSQVNRNKENGHQDFLGYFDCPNKAFQAYKKAKESFIKDVAEKWKDRVDKRVYNALVNYEVEITD